MDLPPPILPPPILNDQDFEGMASRLEELDVAKLTHEETALRETLATLIRMNDDEHFATPEFEPHRMVQYLMDQPGLEQADRVPLLGCRSQVSDLVHGKRTISKLQVKKLAEYFSVSPELFLRARIQKSRQAKNSTASLSADPGKKLTIQAQRNG